jgi:malonate transporter and related proteins
MLATLAVVLPVFALILAGWLARRLGALGPYATTELNRFVVWLALPALLFDVVAHATGAELWQPGFIAAFGLSGTLVFAATLALRLHPPRHLADAAIEGLNAGYSNTGYLGFPLALVAFGPAAMAPTTIANVITVCIIFALAIVLIEIGLQAEASRADLVLKVGRSLIRNPLLVAPALGALIPLFGLSIPAPVETFLKLLAGAASPCALVALGLFLAGQRPAARPGIGPTALLVGLKLIAQPVLAWILAGPIFGLSPLATHVAVLIAALPTGTGPFMLAEFYDRDADLTSTVVLISTILSVVTVSLYLATAR